LSIDSKACYERVMTAQLFADKVRYRAKELRFKQNAVARGIGKSQPQFNKWLQHNQVPTDIEVLLSIARFLDVTVDYLVDDAIPVESTQYDKREREILSLVRKLGYKEAERRLLGLPMKAGDPSPSEEQIEIIRSKGKANRRRRS
jgi:transcriptional regulator with XRE-family HTH domain